MCRRCQLGGHDMGNGTVEAPRSVWVRRLIPLTIIGACLVIIAGCAGPSSTKDPGKPAGPEQYSSVSDMLAQHPFYVAHRGGSATWPEYSMSAYENSVKWGMGALELSVNRTSDGVFFGLHDATLDRTSDVTGNINPNTITWDHLVSTYKNKLNAPTPAGVDYTKASDVFAAYAKDHVIFVDTKYIGNTQQRIDLINLMLSYASADHWVLKGYYNDATLTPLAHQYDIQTWGYYFARDLTNFSQTYPNWDMLGVELSASSDQWKRATDTGKPVIAFFINNQADLNAALAKGAAGVMVSDVPATLSTPRMQTQSAVG